MIKVDLIEYLKSRRNELKAEIEAMKGLGFECVRESRTLKIFGAIGEVERIIKLIEKSHD